jgi:hypothetical protein
MRKAFSFFLFFSFALVIGIQAQTPNAFQYQAVIRNTSGEVLKSQVVNIRFTIRKTTVSGSAVVTETHATTTSDAGIVNLQIGMGTPAIGSFGIAEVDWTSGVYFLQVELESNGIYNTISTQQLLSIPYAKYAQAANSVQLKSPDGSTWKVTIDNNGTVSSTKIQ